MVLAGYGLMHRIIFILEAGFWGLLYDSSKTTWRPSISWALSVSEWEGGESSSLAMKTLLPWSPFLPPVNRDTGLSQSLKGKPHTPTLPKGFRVLETAVKWAVFSSSSEERSTPQSPTFWSCLCIRWSCFTNLKPEVGALICIAAKLATSDRDKPIQQLQSGCNEVRGNPHTGASHTLKLGSSPPTVLCRDKFHYPTKSGFNAVLTGRKKREICRVIQ